MDELFKDERVTAEGYLSARRWPAWFKFLLLALVFGVSYSQYPLYYFTQNQYFFHALARAGVGLLRNDWLANTADPWPVFSLLVELTHRYLDDRVVYIYFVLLLGIYVYSVLGIASFLFRIDRSISRYLTYLALITGLHSPVFGLLSIRMLGFNFERVLLEGVASQRILWDMFQPGAFGVLLLLSIYLFLRGKPLLSVISASVAAFFHPAYVLSAGVLTVSYIVIMVRRGESLRTLLGLGLVAFALVLPVVAYVYVVFSPTSPEISAESQAVLVHFRLARHTVVARWFGEAAYVKVALIAAALYVVRRTEFFWIMFLPFVVAAGLTIVQVLTGSDALALLFPWRISVVLVPMSTVIVVAYGLTWLADRLRRRLPWMRNVLATASLVALVALVAAGAVVARQRFHSRSGIESAAVMEFVKTTKSLGQVYLIPVDWRRFRLFTGAPVFVEDRFIPYNDVAVVEWRKRLRLAEAFYGSGGDARCRMMRELSADYGVTHVVIRGDSGRCRDWTLLLEDQDRRFYAVTP